jgi:predicted transport protein
MEQNLPEKTGKSLDEWKKLLAAKQLSKHAEIMAYLKGECGISHGYANLITLKYREADAGSAEPDDLVATQYQGKDNLKPIYNALLKMLTELGGDVEVAPKKSAVSFRRKRQFALVQPSTKTRIDLGLKFNDRPYGGRLEASGPFGTMCTHRVQLTDVQQLDDELRGFIRDAYAEAG